MKNNIKRLLGNKMNWNSGSVVTGTLGRVMEMGWPSMTASASIPPTPQPTTPSPLIMVVWESVPTTLSGYNTPATGTK